MALTLTTPNTVLGALSPKSRTAQLATNLVIVVLGTALLAAASKVQVPVLPVAITLQSMVVALIAGAFGARLGVATLALYLLEGLSGLPVFSTGGGPGYLMSPSFGFIIGWLPMAFIVGAAADRGMAQRPGRFFLVMVLADAVAFAFGFAWLIVVASLILNSGAELPRWLDAANLFSTAWRGAVEPFVLWDVLKMAFAALTLAGIFRLIPRKG